ncbi:MAG: glycosyltransferase family 39 protein [Bacteroidota bacterium]|nr:glycosyltransferase family 39 protein [Bacteroidota bacterium]MDP4274490.1 glycosyltransferase family 39 protein [Bacteroidota bacterium]
MTVTEEISKNIKTGVLCSILLMALLALFYHLGQWGVTETNNEARYAETAREMYNSGDYIHPTLLNIYDYHKPPVTYYVTNAAFKLFGINEFSVRFFLQVAFLLQLLLVYLIGCECFNQKTAIYAVFIFLSLPLVLLSTRSLNPDIYMSTLNLLSVFLWIKYRKTHKVGWIYSFYLTLALGFDTQGLASMIVPVCFAWAFNRSSKKNQNTDFHHSLAASIFVILSLSWFAYLYFENHGFLKYLVQSHSSEENSGPFWYYLLYIPLLGLPWFFLALVEFRNQRKQWWKMSSFVQVCMIWLLVPLIFFSCSGSQQLFSLLPVAPALSLTAATAIIKSSGKQPVFLNRFQISYQFILLAIICGFVLFYPSLKVNSDFWVFWVLSVILLLAIQYVHFFNKEEKIIYSSVILGITFLLFYSSLVSSNQLMFDSMKPVAETIKSKNLQENRILVYDQLLPSIAFDLQKEIICIKDNNQMLNRELRFQNDQNWRKGLVDLQDPISVDQLKKALQYSCVLIYKKNSLDQSHIPGLCQKFYHNCHIGKWRICY